MKDERPYIKRDRKIFVIGGKIYKEQKETSKKKSEHSSKVFLEEINLKEYDKRIDKIIAYLLSGFDEKKFLRSMLDSMPINEIEMLERRMKKKVTVKEEDGCYGLSIGNFKLDIID